MIDQFEILLNSDNFKERILNLNKVFKDPLYHLITYIGINYSEDSILNLKFYFVTTKKIDLNLIKKDYPLVSEIHDIYNSYIEKKKLSVENLGASFGIKIDNHKSLSYSYYQQVNGYKNDLKNLNLPNVEPPIRNNYFVLESKNSKTYNKQYCVVVDEKNKKYLLNLFKIQTIEPKQINSIEYSGFQENKKINIYPKSNLILTNFLDETSSNIIPLMNHIVSKYNVHPNFPGVYLNHDIKTLYFFKKNVEEDFFLNDSITEGLFI